jgi:5'(3')-deoxyribonucleotidase
MSQGTGESHVQTREEKQREIDKREDLIQAVKGHVVLYDPASNSNRNKFLRDKAWSEVATELAGDGKYKY